MHIAITKTEPLLDAASGDVEVILGKGRYMRCLVEEIAGAKDRENKPTMLHLHKD